MRILERDLDDEQLEIAKAADRSLLVVAGPGSGKTHLLTHVAAHQVRRSRPAHWRVLCLTFSVEATKEIRARLADPGLEVGSQRRLHVANFHQLGSQILGSYGHLIDWPRDAQVVDALEAEEVIAEVITEHGLAGVVAPGNTRRAIQQLRNGRPATGVALPPESLQRLRLGYEARMAELRLRDFDDLILHAIRLLDERPDVAAILRQIYRYLVVDELQDTSGYQMEFIARLTNEGDTPTFAVADNDQMIYGWRDARPENMSEWEARFGAERVSLLGNYRCPPRIVDAANSLITHNARAFSDGRLPYSRVTDRQGEITVNKAADREAEADVVATIVAEAIRTGVPRPAIAILTTNRFQWDEIGEALTLKRIHYVRVGEDPAASRPFARALRAALVLATSPDQERARTRLKSMLGVVADAEDLEDGIDSLTEAPTIEALIDRLATLLRAPQDDPDVRLASDIVGVAQRETGSEPPAMIGRRIALEWHRISRQLQREADAVKLMTTFAAKGLEFETVILPGFAQGQVPYVARGTAPTAAWWEEERRKCYVAITRARSDLAFVYSGATPSRFLTDIDQKYLDFLEWT